MLKDSKIYVAGHKGMVGSAILRLLEKEGYSNIVTRTRQELDLLDQKAVMDFFAKEQPEYVFLAAAKVGGIMANDTYRADFIYENLMVQVNVIHAAAMPYIAQAAERSANSSIVEANLAWAASAPKPKLLFLGSSCIYPKHATQPLKEEYLLTGILEPTNEPYAIAKIAGISLCESYRRQYGCDFISVMPTNLYGPNDNYDPHGSHVLPALLRKFHKAKVDNAPSVEVWGTGEALREFMHVDDMAAACVFLMSNYSDRQFINIGIGEDLSIKDLVSLVRDVVGFTGEILFDHTKPNGTPRKLMDVSRLNELGFKASIGLKDGVAAVYADAVEKGLLS